MKAEPRGKYAGIKLHLDEKECQAILKGEFPDFLKKVGKTISQMMAEHPDMLKERTQMQIVKALKRDQKKIVEQLAAIDKGGNWKAVE